MKKLLNSEAGRQFIRFSIVGVSNTAIDFGVYAGLTRAFIFFRHNFILASVIGWTLAMVWSYFANGRWTYRDPQPMKVSQFTKFVILSLTALLIDQFLLYFLSVDVGIYDLWAKVLAICATGLINFSGQKFWVFRPTKIKNYGPDNI